MWVPHPSEIVWQQASGNSDMGDVTDNMSVARFRLDVPLYSLVCIRGHWSAGTGQADMSLKLDHRNTNGLYDSVLWTFADMGTDTNADLQFRIAAEELYAWTFYRGDVLCFEWTNPDDGVMFWGLDVGLVDASNRQ